MRVIHSCTSESFSGLERYVLDLATDQYRSGMNVELFCREHTDLCKEAQARGLPTWRLSRTTSKGPMAWTEMARDWKLRLSSGDCVLHMHAGGEPWFHLPWLTARPRALKKTILQYHIWINHSKKDPLHWAVYRGIDEVWCSSESARAHLRSLLPVRRDRFKVVFYGRDVETLSRAPQESWRKEVRQRFQISDAEVLGACISRIEPIKGIGELFEAFCLFARKQPVGTLIIVGDVSPNDENAARFAADIRTRHERLPIELRRRLLMPGYLANSERVLAACDFYIVPAYEECNSLSMLDSAILGKAIIGTNSGGTPSVVRPGETGELVPPKDVDAMADALEKLFLDSHLRARYAEGARMLAPAYDRRKIFEDIRLAYAFKSK